MVRLPALGRPAYGGWRNDPSTKIVATGETGVSTLRVYLAHGAGTARAQDHSQVVACGGRIDRGLAVDRVLAGAGPRWRRRRLCVFDGDDLPACHQLAGERLHLLAERTAQARS